MFFECALQMLSSSGAGGLVTMHLSSKTGVWGGKKMYPVLFGVFGLRPLGCLGFSGSGF